MEPKVSRGVPSHAPPSWLGCVVRTFPVKAVKLLYLTEQTCPFFYVKLSFKKGVRNSAIVTLKVQSHERFGEYLLHILKASHVKAEERVTRRRSLGEEGTEKAYLTPLTLGSHSL